VTTLLLSRLVRAFVKSPARRQASPRSRLGVETLEGRAAPALLTGNVLSPLSGPPQLGQALAAPATGNGPGGGAGADVGAGTPTGTPQGPGAGSATGTPQGPGYGVAFSVAITTAPVAGKAFTINLSVLDITGKLATLYTGTVSFSASSAAVGLPPRYTFIPNPAGAQHSFTLTAPVTPGTYTITVSDSASHIQTSFNITV